MAPFIRFARGMRGLLRSVDDPIFRDVQPPPKFLALMDRERARADRLGDRFSLLAFSVAHRRDRLTLRHLLRTLKRRLRLTDEIGWLEDGQLGVLLPGTPAAGAWKVVHDVLLSFPADLRLPECQVYTYPLPVREAVLLPHEAPSTTRPIRAMETLFVRHLPIWKRAVDLCGAGCGLAALLPLMGLIAVTVKLTSRGPVFFVQERSGLGGRSFAMFKFRTMVVDAESQKASLMTLNEQDGPAFKLTRDPRITPVGRLLRKLSLDELPQLWNVIRGEMSLVGPRPLPTLESDGCAGWERRRLDVTPGLTCIWQVKGRSAVSFQQWVRMDVQYIRSRTLRNDLKLLLLTVPAVLLGKGGK